MKANISDETFLVIRYFLTARNDSLDDNKRLSFDKAILDVRHVADHALMPAPGIIGRILGAT